MTHGGGPKFGDKAHKCIGEDYTTYIIKLFLVKLLQCDYSIPDNQDLTFNINWFVPAPKGGLVVNDFTIL